MAGANGDGGEAAMVFDANSFDTVKLWRPSVLACRTSPVASTSPLV